MLHYNDGKAADKTGNRRAVLVVWVAENEGIPALEAMTATKFFCERNNYTLTK